MYKFCNINIYIILMLKKNLSKKFDIQWNEELNHK